MGLVVLVGDGHFAVRAAVDVDSDAAPDAVRRIDAEGGHAPIRSERDAGCAHDAFLPALALHSL